MQPINNSNNSNNIKSNIKSKYFILNKELIKANLESFDQIKAKSELDFNNKDLYYSEYEHINRISNISNCA